MVKNTVKNTNEGRKSQILKKALGNNFYKKVLGQGIFAKRKAIVRGL